MTGRPLNPSADQPFNPSAAHEPGQAAYEAWHEKVGAQMGAWAPSWAELGPDNRAIWAGVEAASQAAPPAGEKRDPVVEAVRADLLRRSQTGIVKYGTMLARRDVDLRGWVRHALEEALDLANYLKRTEMELEARAPERPAPPPVVVPIEAVGRAIFAEVFAGYPNAIPPAYEHERELWETAAAAALIAANGRIPAPTSPHPLPDLLRWGVEERFRDLYPMTHSTRQVEMRATPEWQAADLIEQMAEVTVITVPTAQTGV